MSVHQCIDSAVAQNQISRETGERLKQQYNNIMRVVHGSAEAKAQFEQELLAEAQHKKLRAEQMATKYQWNVAEIAGYRDHHGNPDQAKALGLMISSLSHQGTWRVEGLPHDAYVGQSAEELAKADYNQAMGKAAELTHEFRKGFFSGDLRKRFSRELITREQNIVRELYGQSTDDPVAKRLAAIVAEIYEEMRRAFNQEGGEVGKLERYAGPQVHNPLALIRAGEERWVAFTMGLLDRDRMVHSLTGRKLSDDELREGLQVAWRRITTKGQYDAEVTAAPTGKGAVWKQHADHRWLHFKDADAWLAYAEEYGNRDWYQSFVHYVGSMSRDIGVMRKFGPNPEAQLQALKNRVRQQAALVKPMARVIVEQSAELKRLFAELEHTDPALQSLIEEHSAILRQIDRLRATSDGRYYYRRRVQAFQVDGGQSDAWNAMLAAEPRLKAFDDAMNGLMSELSAKQEQINPFNPSNEEMMAGMATRPSYDPAVAGKIQKLLEDMKEPMLWSPHHINRAPTYAEAQITKAETLWMHVRGQLQVPDDASLILSWDDFRAAPNVSTAAELAKNAVKAPFTASGMAAQRTFTSAVVLGNAVWSSLMNDPVAMGTRRAFIGMPWHRSNSLAPIVDMIRELAADPAHKQWAMSSMVAADDANQTLLQQARWAGSIEGKGVASFLLDRVLTISGLNPITMAQKRAQSIEMMAYFASEVAKPWRELHEYTREWLSSGGFDAKAWDEMRATPLNEHRGALFLRPNEMMAVNEAMGQRYLAFLMRELGHGVLEGHTRVRSFMLGRTTPGSLVGETARTFWHIKTFPATFTMIHMGQMARDLSTPGRRMRGARYAAQIAITGTAIAMLSLSLRETLAGRDPRRWIEEDGSPNWKFVGAAFLQSGGAGIYGDFLSSEVNRFGSGLASTAAGPLIDRYDQILRMTAGNVWQAADGKPTQFGREMTNFIRTNTPMIWQTRLMYDRVFMDEVQKWADPEAYQDFSRKAQNRYRDYQRQQHWWAPGESRPPRAPNFGAILSR